MNQILYYLMSILITINKLIFKHIEEYLNIHKI